MAVIDLTTAARVKTLLNKTDSDDDTLLGVIVTGVSQAMEDYLKRHVEATSRTEEYDLEPRQHRVWLHAYPVTVLGDVKVALDGDFASTNALDSDNFDLGKSGQDGELILRASILGHGPNVLQVTYTGGLGTDTNDIISNHPALAYAADIQCAEEFRRRNNPMTQSRSGNRGSKVYGVGQNAHLEWVPRVLNLMAPYVRMVATVN